MGIDFAPWEPEETIGKLWHAYASRLDAPTAHEGAAVDLAEIGGRLAIFFRGLGGPAHAEIVAAAREVSAHRLTWRRRLGAAAELVERASFDGESLRLPARIAEFPDREANAALYFWLAAAAAHAPQPPAEADPLRADIAALREAVAMTRATLADCPGLRGFHGALAASCLAARPPRRQPLWEAAVEAAIIRLLGGPPPPTAEGRAVLAHVADEAEAPAVAAPGGYRPFRPVPLWPDLRPPAMRARAGREDDAAASGGEPSPADARVRRARRQPADQAERRDSLILYKFEALLSWASFMNLNRRVEDDDEDSAKKAADDQEEIALGQVARRPATRLKLHLDLSPEDADRERLSGVHVYPEWDERAGAYLAAHCRVLASPADEAPGPPAFAADPGARARIRAVRRQFEALRPRRVILPRQIEGDELDLDAAVAARIALRATGACSDRVYRATRAQDRSLSVSILLDVSRSTESVTGGRTVIDIEKEALAALAWGLDACGDETAIHAFSSLRRDRVYVRECKAFDEKMGARTEARIAGLRPGFYTRLGAAVRHVSAGLSARPHTRRLLLAITDGKPNDIDHYEGRHGIEDSRMAVREARRAGHAVHGIVVNDRGQAWFGRIFGRGGYSVIPDPTHLATALPAIYRQLVGG